LKNYKDWAVFSEQIQNSLYICRLKPNCSKSIHFNRLPTMANSTNQSLTPRTDRLPTHQKIIKWMWWLFTFGMVFVGGSLLAFSFSTPSFRELEDPTFNIASEVIADDGKTVLGRYYIENRTPVAYDELGKWIPLALVSTEDARFYKHPGVDYEAMARVFARTFILMQRGSGGGSTITMQLSKLLYSNRKEKIGNPLSRIAYMYYYKLSEMITAVKLERAYTKEEIMAMYLNKYDFGYSGHGIRAASEIYFNKPPDSLKIEEASTLVGMLNNSSLFNPIRRPERTKLRRNEVFLKLFRNEHIKEKEYQVLCKKPLDMSRFTPHSHADGAATYFRMSLAADIKALLEREGKTKPDGSKYDLYRDGLKIYTTINATMQDLAEASMKEHMSATQAKFFKVWGALRKPPGQKAPAPAPVKKGQKAAPALPPPPPAKELDIDPWNYRDGKTTAKEIADRQAGLVYAMRRSTRYERLRSFYLDNILDDVEAGYEGFKVQDVDIDNMLNDESKKIALNKAANLSAGREDICRSIMKSDFWPKIKTAWHKLQVDADKAFKTRTKMKVFSYAGARDTTMTPLDSIKYHRMHLQIGSVGVDPSNGHIKFWVGGINYKFFQLDHVRNDRQVGSTFKPFVYGAAVMQGISPCTQIVDEPQTIAKGEGSFGLMKDWTPNNSSGYSKEVYDLFRGLKESKNTISVYLMKTLGSTEPVRTLAHQMGIDSSKKNAFGTYRVPKQPSICLGATELEVLEMAGAYTTFANDGSYAKPMHILRIVDKGGKDLYVGAPEVQPAMPKPAVTVMNKLLQNVTKGAPGFTTLKSQHGGKTGTTNSYVDGWFMGITPKLVVGTWVGGEDNWIRFLSIADGQGGVMARPFFAKFMQKLEANPFLRWDVTARFKEYPASAADAIQTDCTLYSERQAGGIVNPNGGGSSGSEFGGQKRFQDEEAPAADPNAPATAPTPKPKAVDDGFGG
jgi:penicillin-binding protein 1A